MVQQRYNSNEGATRNKPQKEMRGSEHAVDQTDALFYRLLRNCVTIFLNIDKISRRRFANRLMYITKRFCRIFYCDFLVPFFLRVQPTKKVIQYTLLMFQVYFNPHFFPLLIQILPKINYHSNRAMDYSKYGLIDYPRLLLMHGWPWTQIGLHDFSCIRIGDLHILIWKYPYIMTNGANFNGSIKNRRCR